MVLVKAIHASLSAYAAAGPLTSHTDRGDRSADSISFAGSEIHESAHALC